MSFEENIYDISRLDLRGDFEAQAAQLLAAVRLSRQEVEELQQLLNDLKGALSGQWPGCVVYPFGSIITGLGIKGSDVDCYAAHCGEAINNRIVHKAKKCLSQYPTIFSDLLAIPMAKVPIVKFFHIPTRTHCDVNFKSPSGVRNSRLLSYLLHVHPQALPLAVLIKYWSKVHNLTGTNLMPSYALTLLVVFFLQIKGLLPSVCELQSFVAPSMVENWNTAFQEVNYPVKNGSVKLFTLLGEFFLYYGFFDYQRDVICPYLGRTVPVQHFIGVSHVLPEFQLYLNNVLEGLCRPLHTDKNMCVQDPFEHCRNCAVGVFPRLADKIINLFRAGAKCYIQKSSTFLVDILTVSQSEEVVLPQAPQRRAPNKPTPAQDRGVHKPKNFPRANNTKNKFLLMFDQFKNQKRHKNRNQ